MKLFQDKRSEKIKVSNFQIFKLTAYICLPVFMVIAAISINYIGMLNKITKNEIMKKQRIGLDAEYVFFSDDMRDIVHDLCFLATEAKRHYVAHQQKYSIVEKDHLIFEFLNFSEHKKKYHQIRLIDKDGQEIIRVDNNGRSELIPEHMLQDKSQRYYVKESLELPPGFIYISKFDLNIENGMLELPIRPMIRFCVSFSNEQHEKLGIIALNYNGKHLIENTKDFLLETTERRMLLNQDGYWITGGSDEENWAFMYPERKNITFGNSFSEEWMRIKHNEDGQFESKNGLFTFSTFQLGNNQDTHLLLKGNKYFTNIKSKETHWKILYYYPREKFYAPMIKRNKALSVFLFSFLVLLFVISWFLAKTKLIQKRIKKELKIREKQEKLLIKNLPGIIYRCKNDKHRTMKMMGDSVFNITGYPPENFIDNKVRTFASLIHPEDVQTVEDVVSDAVKKNKSYTIEYRIIDSQNRIHWVYERGQKICLEKNAKCELQGAIFDMTEKKRTEEELKESKLQAQSANMAKTRFLNNMSHEIRTPMNAIMGISQTIAKKPENMNESQVKGIETIYKSGKRLLNLINSVLDLSKIESGKIEPKLEPFSLTEILDLIMQTTKSLINKDDVALVMEKQGDLPDNIISDPQILYQIITNIISNAVKFTDHGSITLSVGYEKCCLYFKVKDTGSGISQESLNSIFEEFTQADDSITRQYQGSGLGLTISKKFIEILGGSISVKSELGQGTTFSFFIPIDLEKKSVKKQTSQQPDEISKADNIRYRILIAEDDKFNQQAIEMMLEDTCDMTFADNGQEALEKFDHDKFDLIFTDIEMPVMDGCTFVDKLHEKYSTLDVPVIAMTAWAMNEDKKNIMAHAFDDYITKPLDYDKLISLIHAKSLLHKETL